MSTGPLANASRKWGDHLLTYLAEGLVMLGTIAVYKLAAMRFGDEGFNVYAIVRRTTSFILPFAMMGMAVAVVRSVAMCPDAAGRWALARTAGLLLLGLAVVVALLFLLFPAQLAFLIFGDATAAAYALPIGGMVLGQMMHVLLYSYWRGARQMVRANILQAVNLAVVPVLAFLLPTTLTGVLELTALIWTATTVPLFLFLLVRNGTPPKGAGRLGDLLRYGLPRVPGDLALAALLTLPVYLVNHVEGLESGGQVAFGLTLLNLVGALFAPISLLMLPSVANALSRGDRAGVVREVQRTRNGTFVIALAMVLLFMPLSGPLLDWYVGGAPPGLVAACRILFSAALFFALFIALRSLLDAWFVQARNSINILWALALFAAGAAAYLFVWPVRDFLLAMVPLSFLLLAVLTWREVHGLLRNLKAGGPLPTTARTNTGTAT
jgi:O-antigen/teichoic acid export membrane protein